MDSESANEVFSTSEVDFFVRFREFTADADVRLEGLGFVVETFDFEAGDLLEGVLLGDRVVLPSASSSGFSESDFLELILVFGGGVYGRLEPAVGRFVRTSFASEDGPVFFAVRAEDLGEAGGSVEAARYFEGGGEFAEA